jgi:hypothetical protein
MPEQDTRTSINQAMHKPRRAVAQVESCAVLILFSYPRNDVLQIYYIGTE